MEAPSQLQVLQDEIRALSDLHSQIQSLRQIPASLLKQPIPTAPFPTAVRSVKADFQQIKAVGDAVRSDSVQKALSEAQGRMEADSSHLDASWRRENRRRRRPPSPESPKPYVTVDQKRASFFRAPDSEPSQPLRVEDLVSYAREFNRTQKTCRLHIWERTRERRQQEQPRMMRFTIPDILTAYITLGYSAADNGVVAQILTAFGPREKKAPHSQSDFAVYRQLSQEIAKMVQLEESVPLKDMVELLCSYEGLFIDRCTVCQRVLSAEGHAPPVVRLWHKGEREPRHVTCPAE